MTKKEIQNIEIDLFLSAIHQRYAYDFRNYARATVKRRIANILKNSHYDSISELIPKLLNDKFFFKSILVNFSISSFQMFRDPFFFKSLRENIIPKLKALPFVKIWLPACATGEEVYSLAILLKEEGLYDKTTIFATDFNDISLKKAENGIYSLKRIAFFAKNYELFGGKKKLSDYYVAKYDSAKFDDSLKERITFANHNLVSDSVFGEMNLILSRNILIYFNEVLQNKVLNLYKDSLANNGFLSLGIKESLQFSTVKNKFELVDNQNKIFQLK